MIPNYMKKRSYLNIKAKNMTTDDIMFCPLRNNDCVKHLCMAYSHKTYFNLNSIPKNLEDMNIQSLMPMTFMLDVGYCRNYNTTIDGGKILHELEKYLGII